MKKYVQRHSVKYAKAASLTAQQTPTTADLAWAAGFLEGEGSFTSNLSKAKWYQRIQGYQNNIEPLKRMQALFGGTIWAFPKKREQATQVGHVWQVNGARARGVMFTLFTFLSAKRRQQVRVALQGGY